MFSILEFENVNCCNFNVLSQNAERRDTHARIQNFFVRGGPNLTLFVNFYFLIDVGREGSQYLYKQAIIDPPAKRHLNGVTLACR